MLRVLDLFSGLGGFSLGLERTGGFETVAFCEIEEFPRKVLKKHWPDVPIIHDVRNLNAKDGYLYDGQSQVPCVGQGIDVITAGFPCQDISTAGKREGLSGSESGLFYEIPRLLRDLHPRWVILENVAAILHRGMADVLRALAEVGYDAEWHCIPASAVGAPHNRDRIWIIAYPKRDQQPWAEPRCRAIGRMGWFEQSVSWDRPWEVALSEFRRMDDGLPRSVASTDGYRNAVVPQIPEMIGYAILEAERG